MQQTCKLYYQLDKYSKFSRGRFSTDFAVQTTAREAHDRDYQVSIVQDACAANSIEEHHNTLQLLGNFAQWWIVIILNNVEAIITHPHRQHMGLGHRLPLFLLSLLQ